MARAGGRQRAPVAGQAEEESDFFIRALARGLSILALFDVEHPEWSLGDICVRTGMSKTTAYRMLRTLETKGFVVHDPTSERYQLGPATIPGAYLTMSYVGFVRSARPFLERLGEATGETVELAVGTGEGAVVVDEVATIHPFRLNRPTGRILSGMYNSSFRMYVAFLPQAEQLKILNSPKGEGGDAAPVDPEAMLERMATERRDGLACDMEELDRGVFAVSAPVMERDGSLKAVLTVVAPAERFGPRARKAKIDALRSAADEMTEYLGGRVLSS
jgi:DNA-binding IclR family transcriptional regulator